MFSAIYKHKSTEKKGMQLWKKNKWGNLSTHKIGLGFVSLVIGFNPFVSPFGVSGFGRL